MVSPATRRQAASHLLSAGFSRVRSCHVVGLSVGAARHVPKERRPELRAKILELAMLYPRFGFRRVHAFLPGINLKAVHRIWKLEGLRLNRRKRRRLKVQREPQLPLTGPNQAWCMDFVHDRLENGRQVRILAALDCFTRECLVLKASAHFPGSAVQRELEWLFLVHGKPTRIVSDNGPEFRALTLPDGVDPAFIEPGKPWQNGYIESFNDKLRDELLNRETFACGAELQTSLDEHLDFYNNQRPHQSLRNLTPSRFKEGLTTNKKETESRTL